MIQKIKDLMAMKDEIDVIKNNINYTANTINDLKTEVTALKEQINNNINEISNKNNEFFRNFNENIESMKAVRHDFEKELFQFKLLKAQLQKKIIEKFEEELDNELKVQTGKLNADAEAYNGLKENISRIASRVNILSEEMNKFISISSNIKKEDFELTRFANKIMEMDREKLELMQKIDTLERLVSKMRRQEFATH